MTMNKIEQIPRISDQAISLEWKLTLVTEKE